MPKIVEELTPLWSTDASDVYFNENNLFTAKWLGNVYPSSKVDSRSIADVSGGDLKVFKRCHFFAGIGGWELAFSLAHWPVDREVWSGSCPCQPFSRAGKKKGVYDARHLWPELYRLIKERRPSTVFGEQVEGKHAKLWLAGVRSGLEAIGYAVGVAELCVAGVSGPHVRQRLFWVADADGYEHYDTVVGKVGKTSNGYNNSKHRVGGTAAKPEREGSLVPWQEFRPILCHDGKTRRIPDSQSDVLALAYGIPARVGRLRAYGNAVVPQVAALFIRSFLEAERDL